MRRGVAAAAAARMRCVAAVLLLAAAAAAAFRLPGNRHAQHSLLHEALRDALERPVADPAPAQWFTQLLDHGDAQSTATWQQRYYVNASSYSAGGPVFVFIGGEGPLAPSAVANLQISVYAEMYGALVVALEHRFYGESQPFADLSLEHLRLLSADQALADLAYFRMSMTGVLGAADSPWVCFGGSYPGSLSAWFRIKYPNLVVGAVSSSAPVLAELDFLQYLQVVQNSLQSVGGPACVAAVRNAFDYVSAQSATEDGRKWLENSFALCAPIASDADVSTLLSDLMGNIMGVVQYNAEIAGQPTIADVCRNMTAPGSAVDNFVALSTFFLRGSGQQCLDGSYASMVSQMQNTSLSGGVGGRQWYYQSCTEFGYFQTTDGDAASQPFGSLVPIDYWTQSCADIFPGLPATCPATRWTNAQYGAKQPQGTNIVFVNGSLDPWHALGITAPVSESETAIFIEGTAHCANMHVWTPNYPPQMLAAQKLIAAYLAEFLL